MKKNKYRVQFTSGEVVIVRAFSGPQASILAQAQQIEMGNAYTVLSVTNI